MPDHVEADAAPVLLSVSSAAAADEARTVPSGDQPAHRFLRQRQSGLHSIGIPTIRLIDGPSHGVVTTDKAKDFLAFARPNPRFKCNRRRVAGTKLFYQSETQYLGIDRVRLLIISGSGSEREAHLRDPGQIGTVATVAAPAVRRPAGHGRLRP